MLIIVTIVAFLAAIIVGFFLILGVHYLIMRFWLYHHLFSMTVDWILDEGNGTSNQTNAEAFAYNERDRLRAALAIPAIILVPVTILTVFLFRSGLIPLSVGIAIIVGFLLAFLGFTYIFMCVEQDGRLICGRIIEIDRNEQLCTFWTTDGEEIELDFSKGKLPDDLVQGKRYVFGQFRYCWDIEACDDEWDEREHPS